MNIKQRKIFTYAKNVSNKGSLTKIKGMKTICKQLDRHYVNSTLTQLDITIQFEHNILGVLFIKGTSFN